MRDEMRLYLAMMLDLKMSNPGKVGPAGGENNPQAEKEAVDQAALMLALMDKMLDGATDIETAKRLNLKDLMTTWYVVSNAHRDTFLGPASAPPPERPLDPRLAEIRKSMNEKMDALKTADEKTRERLRYEFQQLSAEYTRIEKTIPRPAPTTAEQNRYLEEWAFALGLKVDSVFVQALSLYKILTLFEQ